MKILGIALFSVIMIFSGKVAWAEVIFDMHYEGKKAIVEFSVPAEMMKGVDGYKISTLSKNFFLPAGEKLIFSSNLACNFSATESFWTDKGWVFRDSTWIIFDEWKSGTGEFALEPMSKGVWYSWLWAPEATITGKGKNKGIDVKMPFRDSPIHLDHIEVALLKNKKWMMKITLPSEGGEVPLFKGFKQAELSSCIWDQLHCRWIKMAAMVSLK